MKLTRVIALALLIPSCVPMAGAQEWPREPIPARKIRDEVAAHRQGLSLWWTGHNGWLVKSDNLLISTDLATEDEGRLYQAPISAEELAPMLDIAFVTHGHGDHFHPRSCRILTGKGKCVFVLPASCLDE